MNRSVSKRFIRQFSRKEDLQNPFAVGMKMILTAEETSLKQTIYEGLKDSLYFLEEYLGCDNILIYNHHKQLIVTHKEPQAEVEDYVKTLIKERSIGHENKEYLYISNAGEKIRLNVFEVNTSENVYYIVFVDNKIIIEEKNNEIISIIKASLYMVLSVAEKIEKIKELSEMDALTGIKNRHMYNQVIEHLKEESRSVLYMSLDLYRLKKINDSYGHEKGDLYIKQASKLLEENFPGCVYRIGGDEFTIITFNYQNVNEKMIDINFNLAHVLKKSISSRDEYVLNYGYCIESPQNISVKELYTRADSRLYESKRRTYTLYNVDRRS